MSTATSVGAAVLRAISCVLLVGCLVVSSSNAHAAEIVHADGRRETVQGPRRSRNGTWTAVRDGHRTPLRPGEVVAVIDDAGTETELIPGLARPPDPPQILAALDRLRDPKNEVWMQDAERLATRPTEALVAALVELASDRSKELRSRAITALARMRTRESVLAAATAVLAEKSSAQRRSVSSVLFSVWELFRRAPGAAGIVRRGIENKDRTVRVTFALLSAQDDAAATAVLRRDGLGHSDHHVRETAAVEMGRRGDAAGERILVGMLRRSRVPGIDDPGLQVRVMTREKVEICGILGKLGTRTAKAALREAAESRSEAVRAAAREALAPADTARDDQPDAR